MILMIMFNFSIHGTSPDIDPEETNIGHWTIYGKQGVWVNDETDSKYYCYSMVGGYVINPVTASTTAFYFDNTDTGKRESFDNLVDFNINYLGQNSVVADDWLDVKVIWGLIIFALGVGVAASVTIVGTGLSEFGQQMIFISTIYGSLWAFLSLASADLFASTVLGIFGGLIYLGLTISYIIGLAMDVSDSS
jgi:hypothetical protein